MEKVVYVLSAPAGEVAGAGRRIGRDAGDRLLVPGVRGLQLNVVDDDVVPFPWARPAADHDPAAAAAAADVVAVVQVWVDSARDGARRPVDDAVGSLHPTWSGYLVTESEPVPFARPPAVGERMEGFSQIALLRRPAHLEAAEWRRRWQEDHTAVAIATQSTFRYVQNLVVRSFGPGVAPEYAAIVEECFPAGAMHDLHVFYDTGGDDVLLKARMTAMVDSVARFLDVGTDPVAWTSAYILRRPPT